MEVHTYYQDQYLVYDPATSPDYEVVSVSRFGYRLRPGDYGYDSSKDARLAEIQQSEWPPSVYTMPVFSSRSGQWEERPFARQGEATRTIADMMKYGGWPDRQRNAVYWQGALYIHCQTNFVMRISLSSGKYHVIQPPMGIEIVGYPQFYLGKSAKGVYCASIKEGCRVRVWSLDESGRNMEWVLKHDRNLSKWLLKHKLEYDRRPSPNNHGRKAKGPWNFQDINYYYENNSHHEDDGVSMETPVEQELECCSEASSMDDEKFAWSSDDEDRHYNGYMNILGFHPFKEIIFLGESITRGLGYHWNSSKVEVLGNIYPAEYEQELGNEQFIESSFPYTPCLLGQTIGEDSR
ncbi:hypothetical protein BS78_01G131900 [Paspalum vaginatum]|nr:hypothetical protein BS78_01G131900 [Paspalum vaginatum]